MTDPVILVDPDPQWPELAAAEADAIRRALPGLILAVHHIGSTAIPGIKAKPIIDLLVVVPEVSVLDERQQALIDLGYEARGEFGIPGRRFFLKRADGVRTHNVHCFALGDPAIARHLLFRDYLRAHADAAAEYERLKVDLAARYRDDRNAYTDAKTDFIHGIETTAGREQAQSRP